MVQRMRFLESGLAGMFRIQTIPHADARGRFSRLFCQAEFTAIRPGLQFLQANLSRTRFRGTVRGMHFQYPPAAEAKLIHCVRGAVFDVAVDLRAGSPTFGQWVGTELGEDNDSGVFIPEGFAHGFQALTDNAELLYFHTAPYAPGMEGGIRFDDPQVAIRWPIAPEHVSDRDLRLPLLAAGFSGIVK